MGCFAAIFFTRLCQAFYWFQGFNFAKFFHALILFIMCFVTPEQKLFRGQLCYPTLSSVYWYQGLNFVNFFFSRPGFVYSVLWLQSRSCLRQFFGFLTLSSVYWYRGLISLNFASSPWFCLVPGDSGAVLVSRPFFLFPDYVERLLASILLHPSC